MNTNLLASQRTDKTISGISNCAVQRDCWCVGVQHYIQTWHLFRHKCNTQCWNTGFPYLKKRMREPPTDMQHSHTRDYYFISQFPGLFCETKYWKKFTSENVLLIQYFQTENRSCNTYNWTGLLGTGPGAWEITDQWPLVLVLSLDWSEY